MKPHLSSKSAFTLVELLVVIAIMSILAAVLTTSIKSARYQAQTSLCQAHLRNLHQASMNYLADKDRYPYAGSHEYQNPLTLKYSERVGWVAWVMDSDRGEVGSPDRIDPWKADGGKNSHAAEFYHASWNGKSAVRSIREGSLFKYTHRDESSYLCRHYNAKKSEKPKRTYAMNDWFGSRRKERASGRNPLSDFNDKIPSRMAFIIEMPYYSPLGTNRKGEPAGGGSKLSPLEGDSVWDHSKEKLGFNHRKGNKMHSHVIFLDGHIESISEGETLVGGNYIDTEAYVNSIAKGE